MDNLKRSYKIWPGSLENSSQIQKKNGLCINLLVDSYFHVFNNNLIQVLSATNLCHLDDYERILSLSIKLTL